MPGALTVGIIAAVVRHELPGSPVAAVVRVSGHWAPDSSGGEPGWSASAEVLRLQQDDLAAMPELEVVLHVPGAEDPPPSGPACG